MGRAGPAAARRAHRAAAQLAANWAVRPEVAQLFVAERFAVERFAVERLAALRLVVELDAALRPVVRLLRVDDVAFESFFCAWSKSR